MGMKSIEERAKEYADKHKHEIYSWDDLCQYRATQQAQLAAYTKGAEDQKTIDIDKAASWFGDYLTELRDSVNWFYGSSKMKSGKDRFMEAMKK